MTALTVEFCGLPGAGKSCLVAEVRDELAALGVDVDVVTAPLTTPTPPTTRVLTKLRLGAGQLRRAPRQAGEVAVSLRVGGQRRHGDGARQLLRWLAVQELLARSASDRGVHLLDEGPLQVLWSIGLWGDADPLLRSLEASPARWRRPDVLVVQRVRPETACARLSSRDRPHSRLETVHDPAARLQELRRGSDRLDELVRRWERLGVLVVPADEHDPRFAGSLARLLRGLDDHAVPSPRPTATPSTGTRQELP